MAGCRGLDGALMGGQCKVRLGASRVLPQPCMSQLPTWLCPALLHTDLDEKVDHVKFSVGSWGAQWGTLGHTGCCAALTAQGMPACGEAVVAHRTDCCVCPCHAWWQGITWTHDGKGFFYCRFEEPETADKGTETTQNLGGVGGWWMWRARQVGGSRPHTWLVLHDVGCSTATGYGSNHTNSWMALLLLAASPAGQQLMYHVLGTPQSQDVTVLADPDHPTWMFGTEVGHSLRSCCRVESHTAVGGGCYTSVVCAFGGSAGRACIHADPASQPHLAHCRRAGDQGWALPAHQRVGWLPARQQALVRCGWVHEAGRAACCRAEYSAYLQRDGCSAVPTAACTTAHACTSYPCSSAPPQVRRLGSPAA